ncbi:oxygen-independent coproporphyrinogen III oxidase [Candidatus Venteria ishoeyi]|uniref:Coproporphyrinogen-III oxidase n=1 Tax=Candidatus Venteria ishoeyi TaxID=1899563 RepID=A0A1H6FAV9_9GAMM|nr:oxygen-independent coproporphyrinogen III oxidase [Candidatus Venteria ishoeyi]SEH07227.1 Oxygen-independent coproporphyrinogen-III oxidase [Candidatus Venteria ishoeyi]
MDTQSVIFDPELIQRYDTSGPRYTSYPTAVQFHEDFDETRYQQLARQSNQGHPPLSLYFHIPFCNTVCFYCGCNKVVTKDRSRSAPYLDYLYKEMALQAQLFDTDRVVDQLHWGGGTPTFLSHEEIHALFQHTRRYFNLRNDDKGEYSIEIDPREATAETIALLREEGFNRLSLGVQDFDPKVQKAVNRIQSEAVTQTVLDAARQEGFHSLSIDLIYGLPHQSVDSFIRTLDKIIEVSPDRISVFNYAHMPKLFKPQRRINEAELPSADEKLRILQQTITHLTQAGYVYIGMDHFAKPEDELTIAQRSGSLYRNFQGYATHADCDLIGFGATSIGKVANSYSQNLRALDDYYAVLDGGHLPIFRGIELTPDDLLRRAIIMDLMCHFRLDIQKLEQDHNLSFQDYFAHAWQALDKMQEDGLLTFDSRHIQVLPAGRLLIRNICMIFDQYLQQQTQQRFSKVI